MLAVFYGGDRMAVGKAASNFISKQKTDDTISFDETNINIGTILSYAEQSVLFGGKKLIRCDGVFDNEEMLETVLKNLEQFKKSENIFVFLESSIDAETKKKLTEYAEIIEEFKPAKKQEKFNIFSMADALGRRDKKTLWVLLTKAYRAGKSAEEISGTLFWQIKTLSVLKQGGGKTLNPYVVSKNKANLNHWSEEDISNFAYRLVDGYHQSRRGRGDLETAIERLVLSI